MKIPSEFFPLMVPSYAPIKLGDWELKMVPSGCGPVVAGYFQDQVRMGPKHWALFKGSKVWMSNTPFETQSQGYHAHLASGWVVVAGLGMGVLVWNLLNNKRVHRITVLEIDADVIRLMKLAAPWFLEAVNAKKIELIQGDAFEFHPDGKPDLLIVDIWPGVGRDEAESDTLRMQNNIKARTIAWWGQELAFGTWCNHRKVHFPFNSTQIREYEADLSQKGEGCRLLGTDHPAYAKLTTEAIRIAVTSLAPNLANRS